MPNNSFSDYGYVIKPSQPSSGIYGAPPFTGTPNALPSKLGLNLCSQFCSTFPFNLANTLLPAQ